MHFTYKMKTVAFAISSCIIMAIATTTSYAQGTKFVPPTLGPKAALKTAELNQSVFAPGSIVIAALLTGDRGSNANCHFNANVFEASNGAETINTVVVPNVKLTGLLPGLVGPIPANLKPGKYRVEFTVDNEAASACKGSVSKNFEVQRQKLGPPPAKITSIEISDTNIFDGKNLDITINGEGSACNYYLMISNTDNKDEWQLPKISTFPNADKFSMAMPSTNYQPGNYKITAQAKPNDTRPGVSCLGGGNAVTFKKTVAKINLAANTPMINDVFIEPGKKMGGTNQYRNDELIRFNVAGSVENSDGKDVAKQCGWTALLVDSNGVSKNIGANSKFGVMQNSLPLTGLTTGEYMLTVKTTAVDDGLANQPCLGKATKKVFIFNLPGKIKSTSFLRGSGFTVLPSITGLLCKYKVTLAYNDGGGLKTIVTQSVYIPGVKPSNYFDISDSSFVDAVVEGVDNIQSEGNSCEGRGHVNVSADGKYYSN